MIRSAAPIRWPPLMSNVRPQKNQSRTHTNMQKLYQGSYVVILVLSTTAILAQGVSLPPPSRTVYKCVVNKKTVYTDEPCIGAEKVDVEPTRGLNKSTGRELTGSDVARERRNEFVAESLKPLTGMNAQQFEQAKHRTKLSAEAKSECAALDQRIAQQEAEDRTSVGDAKTNVQRGLFASRKRFRELGC
jgi:hypothetical protein